MSVIEEFLMRQDMTIYLVVFDKKSFIVSKKLIDDIAEYIDDCYAQTRSDIQLCRRLCESEAMPIEADYSLQQAIDQIDESFSQMLLRMIDEKGMTDVECYKRANVDRKLFSKIRGDVQYRPSKATAIAFAIALRLDLEQTKDMLMKAGYALSHSHKFDIIIEYFISRGKYDIFEINEALFTFDQPLLGA